MNGADLPSVLIFRKRLLSWSETFIAAQGRTLVRYRPVFVGYRRMASGEAYLSGMDTVVLSEHSALPFLAKAVFKTLGRLPGRWRRAMEDRRPALIHAHFGSNAFAALPIARTLGIPIVATYHGMDIAVRREGEGVRREREAVFAAAARVIAVSEFIADRLRQAGCPPEKIVVHHIGVDTGLFTPGVPEARESGRILFVGRLVPKKGLIHLLRALPRVRREIPGAELWVAGDGPLRAELEAEVAALGIPVRWLGIQPPERVRHLLREGAVLCAPGVVAPNGDAEGLGMMIVEAQASGLPVVLSPSGGSPEAIVQGVTGLVAPAGDEEALAAHLVTLLSDRGLRDRMGAAARAHAVESFDLRTQSARLEEIYDEVRGIGRD